MPLVCSVSGKVTWQNIRQDRNFMNETKTPALQGKCPTNTEQNSISTGNLIFLFMFTCNSTVKTSNIKS